MSGTAYALLAGVVPNAPVSSGEDCFGHGGRAPTVPPPGAAAWRPEPLTFRRGTRVLCDASSDRSPWASIRLRSGDANATRSTATTTDRDDHKGKTTGRRRHADANANANATTTGVRLGVDPEDYPWYGFRQHFFLGRAGPLVRA
jgi:hypothetical protein